MNYSTYIIYSPLFSRYYIGCTKDLKIRLGRHNSGATRSTKPYRPWKLVYWEKFATKTEARKRENQIKSYKHGEAFKKLIRSNPADGGIPPSL